MGGSLSEGVPDPSMGSFGEPYYLDDVDRSGLVDQIAVIDWILAFGK
jgi:hypothetical protein